MLKKYLISDVDDGSKLLTLDSTKPSPRARFRTWAEVEAQDEAVAS